MSPGEVYVLAVAGAMPTDALRREVLKALSKDVQEFERLLGYQAEIESRLKVSRKRLGLPEHQGFPSLLGGEGARESTPQEWHRPARATLTA
jgi:hypothetical protein